MAYAELQAEKLYKSNVNEVELLTNSLKRTFDNNISNVKVKNGKVTINMIVKGEPKTYKYNSTTGKVFLDIINYGSKTEETVLAGDDITIGTEKFKVISNTNGTILAMPYYNLVTVNTSGEVKQGPAVDGISTSISSSFSTPYYWTKEDDVIDINMSDSRNNIQQFILSYKSTLENIGAVGIEVRAAKYSEIMASGVTNQMRNPGQSGPFWIGTADPLNTGGVYFIMPDGNINDGICSNSCGVRPIIVIE